MDKVLSRKLVLVSGKGGIGKSFLSASLGLMMARRGLKVCVVESVAQEQMSKFFGRDPVGHHIIEVYPGLHSINLNSDENFRDFIVSHLGYAKLFQKVFTKPVVKSFIKLIPGVEEMTLLGRLFYLCEIYDSPKFDLVIFDGFATGHFLSLLKTPDAVVKSGMVGPVIDETMRVREYLLSKKTGVILATLGEELVVDECLELTTSLMSPEFPNLDFLVVNRAPLEPIHGQASYYSQKAFPEIFNACQRLAKEELLFKHAKAYLQKELTKILASFDVSIHPRLVTAPDLGVVQTPILGNDLEIWARDLVIEPCV